MKIQRFEVGQQQANCYFIVEGGECLIFDAGDSADFLLEELQRQKLKPLAIFSTHGHFDHNMAVGEIQLSYSIPFYIGKEDLFLIKRLGNSARYHLKQNVTVIQPQDTKDLQDGEMEIGKFSFEVMRTPGHTPGASCFYFKKQGWVLTGDTLFKNAVGRYDFSYGDKKRLLDSLQRLFKLPKETIVYPGHGDHTTIGAEQGKTLPQ